MCKEDIRIGRKKYTRTRSVQVPVGGTTPLVPFDDNRTHLYLNTAGGDSVLVCPSEILIGGFAGHLLLNGSFPVDFDVEIHGDVVTMPWHCTGLGAATTQVLVIETFWQDDNKPNGA